MADELKAKDCRKYLSAFADGELEVEKNLQVLEQMAMNPQHTRRVLHQQQLRKACAKAMGGEAYNCPDALKAKLEAMAAEPSEGTTDTEHAGGLKLTDAPRAASPAAPASHRPGVLATIGRWAPSAVAALFFIGGLIALNSSQAIDLTGKGIVLASDHADLFGKRHVQCSRNLKQLVGTRVDFPDNVSKLPGPISEYFGHPFDPKQPLDLAVLGYEFQKVGQCPLPGDNALHMIYQATADSGRTDSLSLWITDDADNRLGLMEGRLYTGADSDQAHPILVWRQNDMTYYLVGDAMDRVEEAANVLTVASK